MEEQQIISVGKGLREEAFKLLDLLKVTMSFSGFLFNRESNKFIVKNFKNIEKSLKKEKNHLLSHYQGKKSVNILQYFLHV